jgi:hypothetical protein
MFTKRVYAIAIILNTVLATSPPDMRQLTCAIDEDATFKYNLLREMGIADVRSVLLC